MYDNKQEKRKLVRYNSDEDPKEQPKDYKEKRKLVKYLKPNESMHENSYSYKLYENQNTSSLYEFQIKRILKPIFRNAIEDRIQYGGQIESSVYSRTIEGHTKLEIIIVYRNTNRDFWQYIDNGITTTEKHIHVNTWENISQRNKEIIRLYKKERLTQEFIGKIFGLRQPSISLIVKS